MHLWEKLSNLTGASFSSTDTNSESSLNFRDTITLYLNNVPETFETTKSYNKRPLQIKNNVTTTLETPPCPTIVE